MHLHILGICGTFMGGVAAIAKELGHTVTGSDENVYPPMSTQLESLGIQLTQGYDVSQLNPRPDCVIIGNAMMRGNPCVEYVLNNNIPYYSAPEWLYRYVLQDKWVLAVAGTHGKTTTSGMLAWILEYAKMLPGFLIGGVPGNFTVSARAGGSPFFVIEADEYDTAFFDKRSKFLHYRPRTLIFNNLEFDHADIFDDLAQIKKQFHHLIRAMPENGLIISPIDDVNTQDVLASGCWSDTQTFGDKGLWDCKDVTQDSSGFTVLFDDKEQGRVEWQLIGEHNRLNALAAIAAARHVGVEPRYAIEALNQFVNAKRRLEVKGVINGITIYDDFAHHPTAIAYNLSALRNKIGKQKIIAILEFGSYTMRHGVHKDTIMQSLSEADEIILKTPQDESWDVDALLKQASKPTLIFTDTDKIVAHVKQHVKTGDHILVMSNKGFDGIHGKLISSLNKIHENMT